ncbi:MAG: hypothetical protein Q8O09_04085 [Bacillota bacterium]|nr:hypothetical protein [Bacillota bacterium]
MKRSAAVLALILSLMMIFFPGCISIEIGTPSPSSSPSPSASAAPSAEPGEGVEGFKKINPGDQYDLNGDGTMETIALITSSASAHYTICIGAYEYEDEASDILTGDIYVANLFEGDGKLEVFVYTPGPSDDPETYWYELNDGLISGLGLVPFSPGNMQMSGDGTVTGRAKAYFVQTFIYDAVYRLNESRIFFEDRPQYVDMDTDVTMLQQLKASVGPDDGSAKNIIFIAGEKVTLKRVDLKDWLEIVSRDDPSKTGWVKVTDGFNIDGINVYYIFDELVIAD